MSSLSRRWIAVGAILAAIGVGLGAFGSHVLRDSLTHLGYTGDDLIRRTAIWETAVRYQMFHAIAIVLAGFALQQRDTFAWRLVPWAFLVRDFREDSSYKIGFLFRVIPVSIYRNYTNGIIFKISLLRLCIDINFKLI